jgi:hypothetical protein
VARSAAACRERNEGEQEQGRPEPHGASIATSG